ncbi:hypothetical protein ACJQWK_07679 [Exserohilum turcicum]|uniref:Uncharacterized protein n=1 Tax=Exserohilum turcicum (strain 28A) TaxID=671987 RepID=R0KRF2_EXST2|nr:uncharacterized protein SETTUDRAFT_167266 [Exserohilum turcica Et28A]EOA90392.1 hypothetical protein SETTUDRAFT_167266 [Exserohilum turcica Et28A]
MLPQHLLVALVATVAALPLNINLGAYSPALVVGDGEITLGSTESASQLMATLASGAAAGNGGGGEKPPAKAEGAAPAAPAKRSIARRAIDQLLKRRVPVEPKMDAVEAAMEWIKRDLAGFNAALSFAKEAQKDQPKVELGTENSGVGIIVNPGLNVPAGSAAAGAPAKGGEKNKRDEVVEESDSPKMTLVAITEV